MKKLALICIVGLSVFGAVPGATVSAWAAEAGAAAERAQKSDRAERAAAAPSAPSALANLPAQARTVPEFHGVTLRGSFDVRVSQGATRSVHVHAAPPAADLLETVVEGSGPQARLLLRWKPGADLPRQAKALVRVITPHLVALNLEGSGDLTLEAFTTPALEVDLKGHGDIRLTALSTEALAVSLTGNGDIVGAGRTALLNVQLQGNGDVQLLGLRADTVAVALSGNGDVQVNAERSLAVRIRGNGDVLYSGQAQLTSAVNGSGSVRKK